jgi:two-component system sensor histidine kinase CiaH
MTSPARPKDIFARATVRLAALFAGIVVLLVVVSGVIMYISFRSDIRNAVLATPPDGESEQTLINDTIGHFRWQLILIDGLIIVAVGGLGLWYAHRTLRPIRENYAAQRRFIADASHDLRTPLSVMKAELEVALRQNSVEPQTRSVLTSGLEEVDRMSGIVDDLLTLSRIDAHQEELRFADVDLAALTRTTVDSLRPLANLGGVRLTVSAPQQALTVRGDAAHLERALRNLVKNGVEAAQRGGRVHVALLQADGEARVTVEDDGPGMTAEDLSRIFERFYRADAARSRERGGSGLGLPIARWAVRSHGGDITARSLPGQGTVMTISLPLPLHSVPGPRMATPAS